MADVKQAILDNIAHGQVQPLSSQQERRRMSDTDVADAICARLDARLDALEVGLTRRLNRIELSFALLRLAVQGRAVECPGDDAA